MNSISFKRAGWFLGALAICFAAWILPHAWYEFYRVEGRASVDELPPQFVGGAIILIVAFFELVLVVKSLLRKNVSSVVWHTMTLFAAMAMIAYGGLLNDAVERARFTLFSDRYKECAATARPSYADNRFKTCDARMAGDYFRHLVYDTSDEINLRSSARSREFRDFLEHRASAIYVSCRLRSVELGTHFYFLETSCGEPP